MPQYIVKLDCDGEPCYLLWSTVVDAPVTTGGTREEFEAYYRDEYGEAGSRGLAERLARVEAKGVSSHLHDSADQLIARNRAGVDETSLTVEQIVDHYCRGNPLQRGVPFWDDEGADS